jgi:hypothetical protein
MSSTSPNTKHSRFSTFKVFKFTGSKPPPPPPKDANYVYSSSLNHSLLSFTSPQSTHGKTTASSSLSVRTPSPSPSRAIQPSPSGSASVCTLSPDQSPNNSKRGFFRKISGLRKRSTSKNSRVTNPDETTDDEGISLPWNFQVSSPRLGSFGSRHGLKILFFPSFLFPFLLYSSRARTQCPTTIQSHAHTRIYAHLASHTHRRSVRSHVPSSLATLNVIFSFLSWTVSRDFLLRGHQV